MLVPHSEMDVYYFPVLMHNKPLKDTVILSGTVVGHLHPTHPVSLAPKTGEVDTDFINFRDSPILKTWKQRLKEVLSERASVFSLHKWDLGLAKSVEHYIHLILGPFVSVPGLWHPQIMMMFEDTFRSL